MAFFASGRVWERDVVDPIRLSGYREFKWPDGTKYCRAAKQCHPRLACNRDALHRYIGDWHNNLQHGQGVYTFPDGVSIPQDLPSCSCLSSCIPTSWCTKTAVTVQWNPWLDPAPNVPNTSASGMRECHTVRASFCAPCGPPMPTIFTGHGARSYRDGSSFEGDFFTGACTLYRTLDTAMSLKLSLARMAGKRHGNGRLVYPNGDTFEVGKDHRRRCCLAVLELFLVLTGNLP